MKHPRFGIVLVLCLSCITGAAAAQNNLTAVLDSLPQAKMIEQVAIAPDGTQVAYVVDGELFVTPVAGGEPRPIAPEPKLPVRDVAWSPDSRQLAWLADLPGEVPAAQLWTASADGSGSSKVADLKGYAQDARYSPDGSRIALLYIEGMPRVAGPLQPMTPLAGVVGEKVYEQRIAVVEPATRQLTQVTPADMYIYEYDWTPDSKGWAAIAAKGNGDKNWWIARLYAVDAKGGQMREIYKPTWQIAEPRVCPDGKEVAFIEGLMSDEGSTGGDVYLVPLAGGAARNLTPGVKASPSSITWMGAGRIGVMANVDGNSGFAVLPETGWAAGAAWQGWTGPEVISRGGWGGPSATFSRDGAVSAVVRQAGSTPQEIWAGPMGAWKQLTHFNANAKATWGETRNVHWMNGDTRVEGWLLLPANYDPSRKYPLIVSVHGGPGSACMSHWQSGFGGMGAASMLGWFVLCPNPRGSYGQGEAFTQANRKDFGGGDYRDIMAGVDAIAKQFPIDTRRLGIRGHSYGGYMSMWAPTQTTRFAAAVAGAGLSDWKSYYGLNDIDEWMIPFFGASYYDDPAVYRKSDPLHFVKNVKTPTLILVGDRDGEVPMEQSVEWYHALKTLGVPTELVVYPNEGHMLIKRADARDYMVRTLQWFEQWFAKAGNQAP